MSEERSRGHEAIKGRTLNVYITRQALGTGHHETIEGVNVHRHAQCGDRCLFARAIDLCQGIGV